jgi:hypothetical protein
LTLEIIDALGTNPEMLHLSGRTTIKATPITIAPQCFAGYKYSFRHALLSHLEPLHFSLQVFSVFSPLFHNGSQERNQILTCLCERIFIFFQRRLNATAFTDWVFSAEVSSLGSSSPMYEHGEPTEGFPVVDLPLGEEDAFPDTLWDEEIAQRFFDNFNRALLEPPNDSSIIVLSDSDEEEGVRYVKATPSSAGDSPAPTASAADDDDAPNGVQDGSSGSGDEVSTSWDAMPKGVSAGSVL